MTKEEFKTLLFKAGVESEAIQGEIYDLVRDSFRLDLITELRGWIADPSNQRQVDAIRYIPVGYMLEELQSKIETPTPTTK